MNPFVKSRPLVSGSRLPGPGSATTAWIVGGDNPDPAFSGDSRPDSAPEVEVQSVEDQDRDGLPRRRQAVWGTIPLSLTALN